MKQEDFERYEKGKKLIDDIHARKEAIECIEDAINNAEDVQRSVMYVSCGQGDFRIPILKDIIVELLHMERGKIEDELIDLQRQFDELYNECY